VTAFATEFGFAGKSGLSVESQIPPVLDFVEFGGFWWKIVSLTSGLAPKC
jgi:hypothetical protein